MEMTLRMKRADNKLVLGKLVDQDPLSDEIYFSYPGSQELLYFSFVRYRLQNASRICI